jgi:hypothetical protein
MRTIYGYIQENGSVVSSGGGHFDVTKGGPGIYDIHFEPHFNSVPAVVATQVWEKSGANGGSSLDNVALASLTTNTVRFKTGDSQGNAQDRKFTFIAIGE